MSELYERLGLTPEETRVYTIVVSKFVRTVEEIDILAEDSLSPEAIQEALIELEKKKFVRMIPGKVPKYIALAPAIAVTSEIDKQIEKELLDIQDEIKNQWETGRNELAEMVNDFQKGHELFTTSEDQFNSLIQAHMERIKDQSNIIRKQIKDNVSNQNQENTVQLENLISQFSSNLETEVQKNITVLESGLQNIKSAQEEERDQYLGKISNLYTDRIESLNGLFSQMSQSIQTLLNQVSNAINNLNSTLSNISEQTNRSINQNKQASQADVDSIGEEIAKNVTDHLNVINQEMETVQRQLIISGEEALSSINEIVKNFSDRSSQRSLDFSEMANKTVESLWSHLQEIFQSFAQTITSLDEAKEKIGLTDINSVLTSTLGNAKEELVKGLDELEVIHTAGLTRINKEIMSQLSLFQEKMVEDNSQIYEKLSSSIQQQFEAEIDKFKKLTSEISILLDNNETLITQESSETIRKVVQDLQERLAPLRENISTSFSESIEKVIESEKAFNEDSELNLVDMITVLDELNLKIKEVQSERSNKLAELLGYLRNVANEEFSSFGSSANLMLGQMQSTVTENVSAGIEEISQSFGIINQVSEHLSQSSSKIQDEITKILERLQTSMNAGNQTFTEAFDEDIANLAVDVETVTQEAKKKQDEQLTASNVRLNTFKDNIEKATLELSRGIPTKLEEYQARHADDFNTFDRQVKSELNKIRAHLSEINTEVTERLKKRVSLGKAGFQDIEKIVTTAMKEFVGAQKRTEKLIDDQITNFKNSSENFAETINTSLNTQNLEIQRLMETIGDDLVESVNSSYSLALQNISAFSDKMKERFNVRKDHLTDHLGILLSTISTSLGDSLKQGIVKEFNEMNKTLQQLDQTAQAPKELEILVSTEIENFIQNLQLAFQSASESGASRIAEVINESLVSEINTTFETLRAQSDLSNLKETISNQWKASSLKGSSILSHLSEYLPNQVEQLLESINVSFQNMFKGLEEAQTNIETIVKTKLQEFNSNQREKYQVIPDQLETQNREVIATLQETQQLLNNSIETLSTDLKESIKEISTQITSDTTTKLQEHRKLPSTIEETSTQIKETIENQYNNTRGVIENVRSSSLEHLKNMEQHASNERSQFTDQITNINVDLNKELDELKSKVTELHKDFPDKKIKIEEEIQQSINTFGENVQSIFVKLETELNSGKMQLTQKMDKIYQDFQTTLEDFSTTAQNFVTSLDTRHTTILNQANSFLDDNATNSVKSLESEKSSLSDRQQVLFREVDRNLTTLSTSFGQIITDSLETIAKDVQESLTQISSTITEIGSSYHDTTDNILSETLSFFESEGQKTSKKLEYEVANLISEIDKQTTNLQDTITTDLTKAISGIPDKIGSGLSKSKELMSLISEVQNIALEIPIAKVEETFLATQAQVSQTLEAMLTRTKSTIQIMVPKLSMIPWDVLKQAGTRRRIQILTEVDSQETANKIAQELGNVQLKHYDKVEVFAFARDGQEEAAIGTGDSGGVQLIITTDVRLVGVLKEIIRDLWPRGKTV